MSDKTDSAAGTVGMQAAVLPAMVAGHMGQCARRRRLAFDDYQHRLALHAIAWVMQRGMRAIGSAASAVP
jgi:hypothetical protein